MRLLRLAPFLACLAVLAGCAGWPPATGTAEPKVVNYHAEDDQVVVDEQRVRGQLKRATVSPKTEGVAPYEVLPPAGGQDTSISRDTAGQRVWTVFTF
jgi:hypothetical protein